MSTTFTSRPHRRHAATVRLAREHHATYGGAAEDDVVAAAQQAPSEDWGRGADLRTPRRTATDGAQFGLPLLAELPDLAAVLDAVDRADRLLVDAVLGLLRLRESDRVMTATGVDVEYWLAATSRATKLDRSLLRRCCRLLERLPALRGAAERGAVSFAQLRALTLKLSGTPTVVDDALDTWLAAAIEQLPADVDPDVLVRQAAKAVDEFLPELLAQQQDDAARYGRSLTIQPNLFGTGGSFHGTEDALGLAILDAVTAPQPGQRHLAKDRARADNLQTLLRAAGAGIAPSDAQSAEPEGVGHDGPLPLGDLRAPKLLLRCDLDSLLGHNALPASVLTRLSGGRLLVTSDLARRLLDECGAQLRTIIVDQGAVVGVGRSTRVPPDWLSDGLLAIHDTCTAPLCDRPALEAQGDHGVPWTATDAQPAGGTTDVANLGPLCPSTNQQKEAAGWKVAQTTVGQRRWQHARSGLSITTVPATWRPRGLPPPAQPAPPVTRPRAPDGASDPGQHGCGHEPDGGPDARPSPDERSPDREDPPSGEPGDALPF